MRVMPGARVGTLPTTLVSMLALLAALLVSAIALAPRADAFVYWANPAPDAMAIGRANLDGTGVDESFVTTRKFPEGVAVDAHHIYWVEAYAPEGGSIGRANLDGTGVDRKFIRVRTNTPIEVAVDASHVYWTANCCRSGFFGGAVGRANLDGTDVEEGFIPATDGPVLDVSVDATHVYWTKGRHLMSPGVIRRADLDGTGIDYDFITDVREPQGIAVDAAHVYWTEGSVYPDDSPPTIGRANLDGTGVDHNFIDGFGFHTNAPIDLAVDAGHIYWADPGVIAFTGTIGRANLDGTGVDQAFITPERRHAVAVAVNFSLGKLRRNRNRGTAKLTVEVPAPGDVALAQTKKLKGSELRADAAEKVRLPIKPRGKAKQQLAEKGKAMVRADVTYSPDGGEPTTQSKEIKLIKRG